MIRGKVIGSIVSTVKSETLTGIKLLVVQIISGEQKGKVVVAADVVGVTGNGDSVYLVTSKEASYAYKPKVVPVDLSIMGIIDENSRQTHKQ